MNDAPALAQADLGIATAPGRARVEIRDPADVLAAIRLSKATVRKMKQNLFWAAIYDVIATPSPKVCCTRRSGSCCALTLACSQGPPRASRSYPTHCSFAEAPDA